MRCYMKGKIMDIKAMIFFFAKDCRKSPKNSLKIVICACKWKFGSTTFHCSNSVMHELWTLNCLSNERREAYLSIHVHVHLIKKIYDYDSKKLHWIPVSFILGHTVFHLGYSVLFRSFVILKGRYSKGLNIPKVRYSEGPIFRRFDSPK